MAVEKNPLTRFQKLALEIIKPYELAIKVSIPTYTEDGEPTITIDGVPESAALEMGQALSIVSSISACPGAQISYKEKEQGKGSDKPKLYQIILGVDDSREFRQAVPDPLVEEEMQKVATALADNGINYPGSSNHRTKKTAK